MGQGSLLGSNCTPFATHTHCLAAHDCGKERRSIGGHHGTPVSTSSANGAQAGVEYRLYLSKDIKVGELRAHMCRVKQPEQAVKPINVLHQSLCPWFTGLLAGDKPDSLGDCV